MSHHYTESGLDNIYLENGFHIHDTPYGKGVSIQDTEGLHKAIGKWLIAQPKPINGAELRFIRLEMESTQRDLAGIIGATEQTFRLWEKNRKKKIPGTADRLIRALYSEYIGGDGKIRRMLETLAELDQQGSTVACFGKANNNHWKRRVAPSLDELTA
jgi:DNA-binding transcriptional regulator YiaG